MSERFEDNFDELVSMFSMRAARFAGMTDEKVVTALRRVFNDARGRGLTSDDLDLLIDAETPARDRVASKVAWQMSHVIPGKIWGVNLQLLSKRGDVQSSPVLDQVERTGASVSDCNWQRSSNGLRSRRAKWQNTISALGVSHDRKTAYVIAGVSFGSLARNATGISVSPGGSNLFSSSDRLLSNVHVSTDAAATLILARQLVMARFGDMDVVPLFAVVDDIGAGWHFESFDLSSLYLRDISARGTLCLDSFPRFASSLERRTNLDNDSDFYNRLPAESVSSPLYSMPPDRRTRSLMIVDILMAEQRQSEKEVVPVSPSEIRKIVQQRYDIEYPVDMLRHDLISCEQGRRLITRIRGMGPRFTATPVGLARYYWAIMKLSNPVPTFVDEVMNRIFQHAGLVWKARGI